MKLSLQKIQAQAPYSFSESVDVSDLESMDNDIREISEVEINGEATAESKLIAVRFQVTGQMILPCARTLKDVEYPFDFEAVEQFTTVSYEASEENEIHFIDREVLDLTPFIKENILLEVPIRVFSEDSSVDQITADGNGWSLLEEDEHQEAQTEETVDEEQSSEQKVDPRLSSLKEYFKDNND
ncbi:hypothetical protein CEY16_01840 [Halalkalibacillus sediminis]|uniref:DUF177 domain-containing protein n=1 Tax=Halalkalibacillus sediminis TaxID=2018042 RepID=A0A2I0QW03_9BACI|nr:YceD family protein [Halalkalibacillus sediminis]PKR78522.1 hypothetical protein CEY16_01840 [Halalkalibacillus sediminis]